MINNPELIRNVETLNNVQFPSDHRLLRASVILNHLPNSRKDFLTPIKIPKTEEEIKKYRLSLQTELEREQIDANDT